jgi:hypothetical protein
VTLPNTGLTTFGSHVPQLNKCSLRTQELGTEGQGNWTRKTQLEREDTCRVLPSGCVDVGVGNNEMLSEKSAKESKLCQWSVISCQNDVSSKQSLRE